MKKKHSTGSIRAVSLIVAGLSASVALGATPNWAGPYAGMAVGVNDFDATWHTTSITGQYPYTVDPSNTRSFHDSSIGIDGYLGYNFQVSDRWIVGLEADIGHSSSKESVAGVPGCSSTGCILGYSGTGEDSSSVELGWNGSALVRLGYLPQPDLMVYGIAGATWQKVSSSATCRHDSADPLCWIASGDPFATATSEKTQLGWTVGAGFEKKLTGNWLVRAQFRYSDFGKWRNVADLSAPFAPGSSTVVRYDMKLDAVAASVGLTYKF